MRSMKLLCGNQHIDSSSSEKEDQSPSISDPVAASLQTNSLYLTMDDTVTLPRME